MKIIPIALVICYQKSSSGLRLWLQKRQTKDEFQNLLEFPGGKIEASETPLIAAVREFKEEVGIALEMHNMRFFNMYEEALENKVVQLFCFLYEDHKGQISDDGYVLFTNGPEGNIQGPLSKIPYSNHRLIADLLNLVEL